VRKLLVNSSVVAAMLVVELALRHQGAPFVWRVVAMGVVSAVLLGAYTVWRRRRED